MLRYAENPPADPATGNKKEVCVAIEFDHPTTDRHKYAYTVFVNKDDVPQSWESYVDPYAKYVLFYN